MEENLTIKLLDLCSKKEPFSEEEKIFIKKHVPKDGFIVKYGLYRKKSNKNCYISFIIDSAPNQRRRTLAYNNFEIICQRPINDIEYDEQIENYGCNNRVLHVFYYRDIETLIEEDLKYNINTPEEFIKKCKSLGYTKK